VDDFDALCAAPAKLHPSRYGKLVAGIPAVHIKDLHAVPNQTWRCRVVAFADRLYDRAVPVAVSASRCPRCSRRDAARRVPQEVPAFPQPA